MSDETNPYSSQPLTPMMANGDAPGPTVRPTGITVVTVLCLISGVMGILMGLLTTAQLVFGSWMSASMTPQGPEGDAQREFQDAMADVTNQFLVPNIGLQLIGFILAISFIVGGIAILLAKPWARVWMRRAMLAMIVFEILRQIVYIFVQVEMYPITRDFFGQMASDAPDAGARAMMESMSTISMVIGLLFAVGWAVFKIGLLLWGYFYLNREHVRRYFQLAASNPTR